jgi:hypothetical protein
MFPCSQGVVQLNLCTISDSFTHDYDEFKRMYDTFAFNNGYEYSVLNNIISDITSILPYIITGAITVVFMVSIIGYSRKKNIPPRV